MIVKIGVTYGAAGLIKLVRSGILGSAGSGTDALVRVLGNVLVGFL